MIDTGKLPVAEIRALAARVMVPPQTGPLFPNRSAPAEVVALSHQPFPAMVIGMLMAPASPMVIWLPGATVMDVVPPKLPPATLSMMRNWLTKIDPVKLEVIVASVLV